MYIMPYFLCLLRYKKKMWTSFCIHHIFFFFFFFYVFLSFIAYKDKQLFHLKTLNYVPVKHWGITIAWNPQNKNKLEANRLILFEKSATQTVTPSIVGSEKRNPKYPAITKTEGAWFFVRSYWTVWQIGRLVCIFTDTVLPKQVHFKLIYNLIK